MVRIFPFGQQLQEMSPQPIMMSARPMSAAPTSASYFQPRKSPALRANPAFVNFFKNALQFKKQTPLQVILRNYTDSSTRYFRTGESITKLLGEMQVFAGAVSGGDPELAHDLTTVCAKAAAMWEQDLQSLEVAGLIRSLLEELRREEELVLSLEQESYKAQKAYHREFAKANQAETAEVFRRMRERDEAMSRTRQAQEFFSHKAVSTVYSALDLVFEQADNLNKQQVLLIEEVRCILGNIRRHVNEQVSCHSPHDSALGSSSRDGPIALSATPTPSRAPESYWEQPESDGARPRTATSLLNAHNSWVI